MTTCIDFSMEHLTFHPEVMNSPKVNSIIKREMMMLAVINGAIKGRLHQNQVEISGRRSRCRGLVRTKTNREVYIHFSDDGANSQLMLVIYTRIEPFGGDSGASRVALDMRLLSSTYAMKMKE